MPRRRRTRRRRRRRRRNYPRRSVVARGPLFGKYQAVKMRYVDSGQILTHPVEERFIVNSLRANAAGFPNPGSPGALPEGWLRIAPLFKSCLVLGSKVNISFMPSTSQHSLVCFIDKSNVNLHGFETPSLTTLLANRYCRYRYYGQGPGNSSHLKLNYTFSTKKWFTVTDVKDDPDLAERPPAVNLPEKRAYFNFGCQTTHAQDVNFAVDYVAVVDYICLFTDPVNQT